MSRHDDEIYLKQMKDYAAEVVQFSYGRARADLDSDRMYMLATCRLLEMMGEAAYQLPGSSRESLPEVPWKQLTGLRHRLVHAYDKLNFDIIWEIVTADLPPLIAMLDRLIDAQSPSADGGSPPPGQPCGDLPGQAGVGDDQGAIGREAPAPGGPAEVVEEERGDGLAGDPA